MKTLSFLRSLFAKFISFIRQLFGRCNGTSQELPSVRPSQRKSLSHRRRGNLKQVPMSPDMYGLWLANHPHRHRACVS